MTEKDLTPEALAQTAANLEKEKANSPDYATERQRLECDKLKAEVEAICRPPKPSRLDRAERISKISANILIPLLLAIATAVIQWRIATNSVKQDYVKLAVSVLAAQPDDEHKGLRAWGCQLLNRYSEVQMDQDVQQALIDGTVLLPPGDYLTDSLGNIATDSLGNRLTLSPINVRTNDQGHLNKK
jgi:hypothetical protein